MNATHIFRAIVLVIPAIVLAEIGRRTIGGIPVQVAGAVIGFIVGFLALYLLGNFRRADANAKKCDEVDP